jgi:DNA-binding transcriptional MerR regulator
VNPPVSPLKIGQVHALLRRDHPNLELSKIRYYEEMGLVAPARSRKGYRLYSEKDVACLREAIRLADQEFVPLRVIRVRLIEQGLLKDELRTAPTPRQAARHAQAKVVSLPVPTTSPRALAAVPDVAEAAASFEGDAEANLSTHQLLEASQLDPEVLNKILAMGLVTAIEREGRTSFDAHDVVIVRSAAALLQNGADPRQVGALRRVVERELGIIDDLTSDLRGTSTTPDESAAAHLAVARDVENLRAALFERALSVFLKL